MPLPAFGRRKAGRERSDGASIGQINAPNKEVTSTVASYYQDGSLYDLGKQGAAVDLRRCAGDAVSGDKTLSSIPSSPSTGSGLAETHPLRPNPHTARICLYASLLFLDWLAITIAFYLPQHLLHFSPTYATEISTTLPPMTVVACLLYGIIAFNAGAFSLIWVRSISVETGPAVRSLMLTYGALFLISYFFRLERDFSRLLLALAMILSLFLIVTFRVMVGTLIDTRLRGRLVRQVLLCDNCNFQPPADFERIDVAALGLRPDLKDPAMLNMLAQTIQNADRVTIACQPENRRNWAMMLKGLNVRGEIIMDEIGLYGPLAIGRVGASSALTVSIGTLPLRKAIAKRAFDLACCIPAVIALAPALAIIALAIKLDSKGPVLFRQRRVGRGNEFFHILKFRSMRVERTDSDGSRSASRDDDRITRVGYFIRRTSIDELPQLFNVLLGQMSIVGPRPHALGSLAGDQLFWDVDERYWHRHALKPGITGLAQVRGYRGATVYTEDLTNRLQADLEYIANWSFWKDLAIVFMTLKVVVHRNTY